MSGRRAAVALLACLSAAALAALAGFFWFVHVAATPGPSPTRADGIVALTGGAERVETALRLLADGRADVLLVSGVGGMAEFSELARRAGIDAALGGRVTLGRAAASTRGNAAETAEWARANGVRSLLVVTAGYHMPRAMAELARAMPGVRLSPVVVLPREPAPLRLLAAEYIKYLAAAAGLSAFRPLSPPPGARLGAPSGEAAAGARGVGG